MKITIFAATGGIGRQLPEQAVVGVAAFRQTVGIAN